MPILLCVVLTLSACQSNVLELNDTDRRIYLSVAVESSVQTRTPYTLTTPTPENPVLADVWASTTSNIYKHVDGAAGDGSNNVVSRHTKANFQNGSAQLLIDAIYPQNNTVNFVAMHPQGWVGNDAGISASYTFDGKTDVMFAPQTSGKYGDTNWPKLTFKHLLTWLRIEIVAESEAISDAWGELQSLTIKSSNNVTIDLQSDYRPELVTFGSDGTSIIDMPFYKTGENNVFPDSNTPYTIPAPPPANKDEEIDKMDYVEEVAYVLCEPVTASKVDDEGNNTTEYTLTVQTTERTVEVPVDLMSGENTPYGENTMGKQFTLLLNFKMGNTITVAARTTDWETGGIASGEITE